MTFRARLTVVVAIAVAVAAVVSSVLCYVVVRGQLRGEIDSGLRSRAQSIEQIPLRIGEVQPGKFLLEVPPPFLGGPGGYVQLVKSNGSTARPANERTELPVTTQALRVAAGTEKAFFTDATVAGAHVRALTTPLSTGWALQVIRPLSEFDHTLGRLRALLVVIALGGVLVAAGLALLVTRTALAPLRRLTKTAEHVTETKDLTSRIDGRGNDEVGRLVSTFNTMLAALEESSRAQQQLVADASHELRTPLTSLRTNIEVLAREDELSARDREQLLNDVVAQLTEMTTLVAELVELARDNPPQSELSDIDLAALVDQALERARRNHPQLDYRLHAESSLVRGVSGMLERAVSNLLDNAAKWSPPDGAVEVSVAAGEISVRDYGPGISDEDRPYVFDRFYRASNARSKPGSGLGLAIVKQVAQVHNGEVVVQQPADGGTRMVMRLPLAGVAA